MRIRTRRSSQVSYLFVTLNLVLLLAFLIIGTTNLRSVQATITSYDELVHEWYTLRTALHDPRTPSATSVTAMPEYLAFRASVEKADSSAAVTSAAELSPELRDLVARVTSSWSTLQAEWAGHTVGTLRSLDSAVGTAALGSMDRFETTLLRSQQALGEFVSTQQRALSVLLFCLGATIVLVIVVFVVIEAENERARRAALRTQMLARNTIRTQEHERERIAHDLHDSLAQELSLATLEAELIERNVNDSPAEAHETLRKLKARLRGSIDWIRNLAYELRPAEIDSVGLAGAVTMFCRQQSDGAGPDITWDIDAEVERIPAERAIDLYRIVQESVTNAVRHARATQLAVTLHVRTGQLVLTVADNGVGIAGTELGMNGKRRGLGIAGMEERAAMLGAELAIRPAGERGTEVRLSMPLEADAPGGREP
jgi:signal transduction histidine kinase